MWSGTDGGEIHKEMKVYQQLLLEYVRVIFIALMRSLILEIIFLRHAKRKYYSTSGQIQQLQYGKEF